MVSERARSPDARPPHPPTYLLEVLVAVDVLLVVRVLQLVGFDVLPEGLDDAGAGLGVNAQQASQAGVQLKLGGLHRRRTGGVRRRLASASGSRGRGGGGLLTW